MRMLLAGGGTGGHLFPAVAIAQRFLATEEEGEVLFVGTERGLEAKVLPELGLPLQTIDISGLRGTGLRRQLALVPRLLKSLGQSLAILRRFQPDVVVGVGGYASGPLLMAAVLKRLPVLIHEQNAWPGLTNRLLAPWADRICLSFADTDRAFHRGRTVLTGNPLRVGMEDCPPIEPGRPLLLVFGGSRGARAINEAMAHSLPLLEEMRGKLDILHQTGAEDLEWVRGEYDKAGWNAEGVVPFIDRMAEAYRDAHLVLCRAGATSIAELTACGRPAILVPFPHAAGDHQSVNARALVRKGAALMLHQSELTPKRLARLITTLLGDHERLQVMAALAKAEGKTGAADRILRECRAIAKSGKNR